MTAEQEGQRARIAALRAMLKAALNAHEHSDSDAGCAVCGEGGGWECPDSPDSYCHYRTVHGSTTTVRLRDGTTVELSEPAEYQSDDSCLFCGEPDERK